MFKNKMVEMSHPVFPLVFWQFDFLYWHNFNFQYTFTDDFSLFWSSVKRLDILWKIVYTITILFVLFFQEKTDKPHEDTNHITRLSLDGLASSESMPLLSDESSITSRCTSSLSMDQLSTMTAITSFDVSEDSDTENTKLTVQNLIVISKDPSPDLRSRLRPRPFNTRYVKTILFENGVRKLICF